MIFPCLNTRYLFVMGLDLILLDVFPYVVFLRTQSLLFHLNVWILVNLLKFSAKNPTKYGRVNRKKLSPQENRRGF